MPAEQAFILNLCVSLAVYSVLEDLGVPALSIKWPNDILSGTSKLCGILIENRILGNTINTSIIGIGLNVNQLAFENLPNVSSLKLLFDRNFDLDDLLHEIIKELKAIFSQWGTSGPDVLWTAYRKVLFRKGKTSTFEGKDGALFRGCIEGITLGGKLMVALNDEVKKEFSLKEVRLLF